MWLDIASAGNIQILHRDAQLPQRGLREGLPYAVTQRCATLIVSVGRARIDIGFLQLLYRRTQ